MAFLSSLLRKVNDFRGAQGVQGTTSSIQGVQGTQGTYGTIGTAGTTLLTNTQSGTYTLQASDVGKVVSGITTVGIPSDVFNPGENIIILNNESNSNVIIDIAGASPVVSIYESGVVGVLTETKRVKRKSFASVFCTRVNEFILSNIFDRPIEATGGTIIDSDGYRIHVFTGIGTFSVSHVPTQPTGTIEYLVVAGGGGSQRAGGGAGGFRTGSGYPITVQNYTITVGGGGAAGVNGQNSVFDSITSAGGGYGAFNANSAGGSGGSGGGAAGSSGVIGSGNIPPVSPPQGNPGGPGFNPPLSAVGGGGGGAGLAGLPNGFGGGGSPIPWASAPIISPAIPAPIQPTWIPEVGPNGFYAGGGSGNIPGTSGGAGGGGDFGQSGVTNTGGGGGGPTTSGGSGIVIIRYLL